MSFDIPKVETPEFYIEVAFSRAQKKAKGQRGQIKGTRLTKSRSLESTKLTVIKDVLSEKLLDILKSFPSLDDLTEFYKQLIKATMDYAEIKKSFGAMNWAIKKIQSFFTFYNRKILKCDDLQAINKYRTEYYGRISSVLNQIKSNLMILEEARLQFRDFPSIKSGMKTVAIAGFPNVGKTTLLQKLTGSKPEIASYPFTTKGINVGYMIKGNDKVQLLDTPGTLNRFDRMNNIEKAAYLALKYCAEKIIYVFDFTEPYPLEQQKQLLAEVKRLNKPIFLYLSKTDILDKKLIAKNKLKTLTLKELKQIL